MAGGAFVLTLSMIVITVSGVFLYRSRAGYETEQRMRMFFPLSVATIVWTALEAVRLTAAPEYFEPLFHMRMFFVCGMPYLGFWAILVFTESELTKSRYLKKALVIMPSLSYFVFLTNPLHGRYYFNAAGLLREPGSIFWAQYLITFAVFVCFYIIWLRYLFKNFRKYTMLLAAGIGAVLPVGTYFAYAYGIDLFGVRYDFSPMGFFVANTLFVYGVYASRARDSLRSRYGEVLVNISKSKVLSGTFEDAALMIAQEGCAALSTQRIGIWKLEEEMTTLRNIFSYQTNARLLQRDSIDISGCKDYLELLMTQRYFVVSDTTHPNALSSILDKLDPALVAFIHIPLREDGNLTGILYVEQLKNEFYPERRIWSQAEHSFASSLADFVIIATENAKRQILLRDLEKRTAELETAYKEIEQISLIDKLTSIPNRRCFDDRLELEWAKAIRNHRCISLLIMDIDDFKIYNDTYGHQQGDVALQMVAKALPKTVNRTSDFSARWGGEEFAVLLPDTDLDGAMLIAEKVRLAVSDLIIPCVDGAQTKVTVSIGVNVTMPLPDSGYHDFIAEADKALYQAKKLGKNQTCHVKTRTKHS